MANTTRSLQAAIACAVESYERRLTLADLAAAADLPTNTLTRMFNRRFGMSPMRWVWRFRTILAAECIARSPEWPLAEIAEHCGFTSSAHFSRRFRELFRESPSRFRRNFRKQEARQGALAGSPGTSAKDAALSRAMARPSRAETARVQSTEAEN